MTRDKHIEHAQSSKPSNRGCNLIKQAVLLQHLKTRGAAKLSRLMGTDAA
jgi:hypothetical protein